MTREIPKQGRAAARSRGWCGTGACRWLAVLGALALTDTRGDTPTEVLARGQVAPAAPLTVAPADGAGVAANTATPTVAVTDPAGTPLTVTFYGRARTKPAPSGDFTVVVLPDTQFYAESYPEIFQAQTRWIVGNRVARHIVYVTGLGDVVNVANAAQYEIGSAAFAMLEDPATTGLPQGIPFGVPVGNHDGPPSYTLFKSYFPTTRFSGRDYYGGSHETGYQNHYDLFSAGGMDFLVLSLEYNAGTNPTLMTWANGILQSYPKRRAIVVSHSLLKAGSNWPQPAAWSTDGGTTIFPALSSNANLFLMLCGHNNGKGRRHEPVGGRFIDVLLADYQGDVNGGDGYLRTLEFSPANHQLRVKTYSPSNGGSKTDGDNEFTLDCDMSTTTPFVMLGTRTAVVSGSQAAWSWPDLAPGLTYEWYATASDGSHVTAGSTNRFTVGQH